MDKQYRLTNTQQTFELLEFAHDHSEVTQQI